MFLCAFIVYPYSFLLNCTYMTVGDAGPYIVFNFVYRFHSQKNLFFIFYVEGIDRNYKMM